MENKIEEYAGFIIAFCIFTFLVGITFYVAKQFYTQENHLSIMNCVILFWTMISLIWYTWETSRLRKSAQKQTEIGQSQIEITQHQTEIQQRPFVIFEVIDCNVSNNRFIPTLKNIGNGIAFNVRIKEKMIVQDIDVDSQPENIRYVDIHSFQYNSGGHIIKKDDDVSIHEGDWRICPIKPFPALQRLIDKFELLYARSSTRYRTRIEFQNIEMDWYYVEQETNSEGIFIIKSGRF